MACDTHSRFMLETRIIAKEIMDMLNDEEGRLRCLKELKEDHVTGHALVVDALHKMATIEVAKPKKKWQVNVLYQIQCSHVFEVEADNKLSACLKAEELCSNTDMMQHMQQGCITETEIIGGPDVKFKNPSGQVGSKRSAGSKNKSSAQR